MNRTETATAVLAQGGYFRKQLEIKYMGREQFVTRLRDANGQIVRGVGFKTWAELQDSGKLRSRSCAPSSCWPEEWIAA